MDTNSNMDNFIGHDTTKIKSVARIQTLKVKKKRQSLEITLENALLRVFPNSNLEISILPLTFLKNLHFSMVDRSTDIEFANRQRKLCPAL